MPVPKSWITARRMLRALSKEWNKHTNARENISTNSTQKPFQKETFHYTFEEAHRPWIIPKPWRPREKLQTARVWSLMGKFKGSMNVNRQIESATCEWLDEIRKRNMTVWSRLATSKFRYRFCKFETRSWATHLWVNIKHHPNAPSPKTHGDDIV